MANSSYGSGFAANLTVTTESWVEPWEVGHLRQLVQTKDGIIAALRRQIAHLEGTVAMYRTELGNGEGLDDG